MRCNFPQGWTETDRTMDSLHVVSRLFKLFGQTELILKSLAPQIGHVVELTGCFFVQSYMEL